jgi:hypothetical protein
VNLEEDAETVRRYINDNGFTFPVLLDSYGDIKAGYEVEGYPTNFILDREGMIIAMNIGSLDWNSPEIINTFNILLGISGVVSEKEAIADSSEYNLQLSDAERFALEYPLIGSDNIFVFKTANETANILANGTGVVFIGFKECPWCQLYVVFLHDVAREIEIEKIFYCDIREDRQNNSESYQRIVDILSGQLQFDDEGRPRVFVPDVTIVNSGKIVSRDFETSKDTLGYRTAQEYWNEDRVNALKDRFREGMKQISGSCEHC